MNAETQVTLTLGKKEESHKVLPEVNIENVFGKVIITLSSKENPSYEFSGNITGHFVKLAEHGLRKAYKLWQSDNAKKGMINEK